jgi:hypothetical protein
MRTWPECWAVLHAAVDPVGVPQISPVTVPSFMGGEQPIGPLWGVVVAEQFFGVVEVVDTGLPVVEMRWRNPFGTNDCHHPERFSDDGQAGS